MSLPLAPLSPLPAQQGRHLFISFQSLRNRSAVGVLKTKGQALPTGLPQGPHTCLLSQHIW